MNAPNSGLDASSRVRLTLRSRSLSVAVTAVLMGVLVLVREGAAGGPPRAARRDGVS